MEEVMEQHGPFVRRTLGQLGVPARDLADVAQEVFRGVAKRLAAFDPERASTPENAVRSWLFGICERQAASYRRAATKRAEVLVASEHLDDLEPAEERTEEVQPMRETERRAILAELLDTLDPDRRAVLVAYELEEREMAEVAALLNIPVNTGWNRLRLARRDLAAAWIRMRARRGRKRR